MAMSSVVLGLLGGALIGLGAALALWVHGRIAGISGILGRAFDAGEPGDGRTFRLGFLAGLVATGAIVAAVRPSAFGAAAHTSASAA
jgi:hypothetical protein